MKKVLNVLMLFVVITSFAQVKDTLPNFDQDYYLIRDGESLMIELDEVTVLPKHKFKSRVDFNYYYWFKKKVFKAYPYAVLASKRLDSLNERLTKIKSKRKRKKYVKKIQSYVENELTDQLKKMTRTEGRILIKLIHRQTGETAFENIKELRSGWKAFWYNTTANVFKLSLKDEYTPETINEDYLIEDILQRAYIDEKLEYQEPKLKLDYAAILQKRQGEVNVDKYKAMFAKARKKKKKKQEKTQKKQS